ncbi:MAG TPA: rhodanese-like domain-containing protein [Myxococcota bacterium]|nr:rhodanese-like domain-containing protein [Myxococcota bacterium]
MIGKLAKLPLRLAKAVGKRISEAEMKQRAEELARSAPAAREVDKERIPEHELDPEQPEWWIDPDAVIEGAWFLDVRAAEDFTAGHLPGAEHMREIDVMIQLAELPPDVRIVAYDEDGPSAMRVTRFLRRRGFDEVVALRGGVVAWERAGGRIE